MRTRSRLNVSNIESVSHTLKSYSGTCANPELQIGSQTWTLNLERDYESETMTDLSTPDFKKRQSKGEIVNSPMKHVRETRHSGDCIWSCDERYTDLVNCGGLYVNCWRGSTHYGNIGSSEAYLSPPSINIQNLIDTAVTQAWANCDSSKAMALASLGEGKETIRSVVDIFGRLIKIIKAIKSLDTKYLLKQLTPKELKDRYMEVRYAIRPLIYDVNQIIEAIKYVRPGFERQTFRGFKRGTATATSSELLPISNLYSYRMEKKTEIEVEVRAGVLCQVDEPNLATIWGLDKFPETLWELTTLSFVIDWFFNVGKIISSWTPRSNMRALASWYVVRKKTTSTTSSPSQYFTPVPGRNYISPSFRLIDFQKYKILEETERVISPKRAILPSFDLRMDVLKLLDLVIIAEKLFSRK